MKTYFENSMWVVTVSLTFMVVSFINSVLGVLDLPNYPVSMFLNESYLPLLNITSVFYLAGAAFLVFKYVKLDKSFPKFMVWFTWACAVVSLVLLVSFYDSPLVDINYDTYFEIFDARVDDLLSTIVIAFCWMWFFKNTKVKEVFN